MQKLPEVKIYRISAEEWAEHKAEILAELRAMPEWWNKLADCHVKCSMDEIGKLAHSLWFDFTDEEIVEIYAEAERIRNARNIH